MLIEHGICLPSRRRMRNKPPAGGRTPPIVAMRLIDERPDSANRMIPGTWEEDLVIGKDGANACATPGRAHHPLPDHRGPASGTQGRPGLDTLTHRIQGLPEGAMRTLTWDQGREMARHQRLTPGNGVEVLSLIPTAPGRQEPTTTPTDSSADTCPQEPPSPATNPTSTPSPTSRATAPEQPSATAPPQKHSTNSLLPPINTADFATPRLIFDTMGYMERSSCPTSSATIIPNATGSGVH